MSPPRPPLTASLLREPLVHFALGALALLAAERAAARWRPASPAPLAAGADLREEALVREAVARGLDRGDPVIRQRLVQKLTFLLEAESSPEEPDDATLQRWLDAHAGDYRRLPAVSFEQVFFARERRGAAAEPDAAAALRALAPDAPLAVALARGDPSPAGASLPARRFADVTRAFGYAFARALDDVAPGAWRGPLASPAGWHLVRVTAREPGGAARLADVRADARRRWLDERRAELTHAAVERVVRRRAGGP